MNKKVVEARHKLIEAELNYVRGLIDVLRQVSDTLNREHYLVDAEYNLALQIRGKLEAEENESHP